METPLCRDWEQLRGGAWVTVWEETSGLLGSKLEITAVEIRSQKDDLRRDSGWKEEHMAGRDFRSCLSPLYLGNVTQCWLEPELGSSRNSTLPPALYPVCQ